jgi:hypothetical protein
LVSVLAGIVFIVVATALHTTESSVSGLIDRIKDELDKVDVPNVNPPDVKAPNVNSPDANPPAPSSGGDSGGSTAPGQ